MKTMIQLIHDFHIHRRINRKISIKTKHVNLPSDIESKNFTFWLLFLFPFPSPLFFPVSFSTLLSEAGASVAWGWSFCLLIMFSFTFSYFRWKRQSPQPTPIVAPNIKLLYPLIFTLQVYYFNSFLFLH